MSAFTLRLTQGKARRGELVTAHGVIQTPVFMNVGTVAAIKGAVSAEDLEKGVTYLDLMWGNVAALKEALG